MTYDDRGFKKLTWNFFGILFMVFQIHFSMFGAILPDSMLYALNAWRCLIFNLPFMQWQTLAMWYYIVRFFGLGDLFEFYVDGIYLATCTCATEAGDFSKFFGATDKSILVMSQCTSSIY